MSRLEKKITVPAALYDVWDAWTTSSGVTSFGPTQAKIELKIGGAYEWLFDLKQPVGSQGSEGCKVLSYLPMEMISFSWNAPPHFKTLRNERTWVVVRLHQHGSHSVEVRLDHLGWQEGGEWPALKSYFDNAWDRVLESLYENFGSHHTNSELAEEKREDERELAEEHEIEEEEDRQGE